MYYPEEVIEEVRMKNDIVDVISGYVRLQKKGSSFWGLCPFHNEKSPSFSVSGEKQMYHCFGCGVGGNVFTFLMNYESLSFPEAVRTLAERGGVNLPEPEYSEETRRKEGKRARLLEICREAAKFFYYQLRSPHGEIGYRYFRNRELTDETMKKFGLGYAGKSGAQLVEYLRHRAFEDELIREAGLANYSEKYGMMSQFWNRVMFPIQDINHRVIGFGGRVMGEGEPKYLNSPETPVFDKRRNLYGLNFARTARSGNIILCEGYMDVIAMHQAGFGQAVASLGTAFTPEQAALLRRYTDSVLLAYDSDGAGVKAALRAVSILREAGLTAKVINMQPFKDPDEFMKHQGQDAFRERTEQAENSFFFELRVLQRDFDMEDPEAKTRFHREIAKKLCAFGEALERENYLQAAADKYHIQQENLRSMMNTYAAQTGLAKPAERPRSLVKKADPLDDVRKNQRLLITWISDEPAIYPKIKGYISPEDFTEEVYRRVAERLFADLEKGENRPAAILDMFTEEEEHREASALFNTNLPDRPESRAEKEKALHDILYQVKRNSMERKIAGLGKGLADYQREIELRNQLNSFGKTHISLE